MCDPRIIPHQECSRMFTKQNGGPSKKENRNRGSAEAVLSLVLAINIGILTFTEGLAGRDSVEIAVTFR